MTDQHTAAGDAGLLPCPFCGGCDVIVRGVRGDIFYGACDDCDIEGPHETSERKALAAWNRRTSPPASIPSGVKDAALEIALEALEEITLAGMSLPMEAAGDDEAKDRFHARQAWNFIGIAARAKEAARAALKEQP